MLKNTFHNFIAPLYCQIFLVENHCSNKELRNVIIMVLLFFLTVVGVQ